MPIMRDHEIPMISVLMGIYYRRDSTELLHRSVQSILSQTYREFELLICDDGSTHAAKKEIDLFVQNDMRVRLVRRENLLSLPEKLNACLELAEGTLVARMDDDDFSYPNRFDKQVAYLEQHPEIDFVGSNVRLMQNNEILGVRHLPVKPEIRDFLFVQPFVHPTMMFRRNVLLEVGGYSEDKSCCKCEDYDLLLRLYEFGFRGVNLQESLLDYSMPTTAKGSRTMRDRWNETVTRRRRFQSLGLLPKAWPYVIKPLMVGLLPESVLTWLKSKTY